MNTFSYFNWILITSYETKRTRKEFYIIYDLYIFHIEKSDSGERSPNTYIMARERGHEKLLPALFECHGLIATVRGSETNESSLRENWKWSAAARPRVL